jgi:hypothetical protein
MLIPEGQLARDLGFGGLTQRFAAWVARAELEPTYGGPGTVYNPYDIDVALRRVPIIGPGRFSGEGG